MIIEVYTAKSNARWGLKWTAIAVKMANAAIQSTGVLIKCFFPLPFVSSFSRALSNWA